MESIHRQAARSVKDIKEWKGKVVDLDNLVGSTLAEYIGEMKALAELPPSNRSVVEQVNEYIVLIHRIDGSVCDEMGYIKKIQRESEDAAVDARAIVERSEEYIRIGERMGKCQALRAEVYALSQRAQNLGSIERARREQERS